MTKMRVKLNTRPVAGRYAAPDETIMEFSSPNGGGLVSFTVKDDGRLDVQLYRLDGTVDVRTSYDDQRTPVSLLKPDLTALHVACVDDHCYIEQDDRNRWSYTHPGNFEVDKHDDNDDCAKYDAAMTLNTADNGEVDARDVNEGDLYRELGESGGWFEVDTKVIIGSEVHLDGEWQDNQADDEADEEDDDEDED